MAAITWRNVTGASAGNPASALAGATSAFSSASRGALDLVDSIRKGTKIKNEELTNRAIADVLASGKPLDGSTLGDFAPGVNTADVLESIGGFRSNQASIRSSDATAILRGEQTSELAYKNTPEYRAFQQELQEAEAAAREGNLQAAQRANQLRGQEYQLRVDAANRDANTRAGTQQVDSLFNQELGRRLEPFQAEIQAEIQKVQNSDLNDTEKAKHIRNLQTGLAERSAVVQQETAAGFLPQLRAANSGISQESIDASGVGQQVAAATARAEKRQDATAAAAIKTQDRIDQIYRGIAGGASKDLKNLGLNVENGDIIALDADQARANTITLQDGLDWIQSKGTDFNRDEDFPEDAAKDVKRVWTQVGGNKQLFELVMDGVEYDSEGISDQGNPFNTTDEVHKIPTFAEIEQFLKPYRQRAGEVFTQRQAERTTTQGDGFNAALAAARKAYE